MTLVKLHNSKHTRHKSGKETELIRTGIKGNELPTHTVHRVPNHRYSTRTSKMRGTAGFVNGGGAPGHPGRQVVKPTLTRLLAGGDFGAATTTEGVKRIGEYTELAPPSQADQWLAQFESESTHAHQAPPPSATWFRYMDEGVEIQPPPRILPASVKRVDAELIRRNRYLRTGGSAVTLGHRCIGDASFVHWAPRISELLKVGILRTPLTLDLTGNELGPSGATELLDALVPQSAALAGLILSSNPHLVGALPGALQSRDFDRFAGGEALGTAPPRHNNPEYNRPRPCEPPSSTDTGRISAPPRLTPHWAPLGHGLSLWLPRLIRHIAAPSSRLVIVELDGIRLGPGGVGALCTALGAAPAPPLQALGLNDCGLTGGANGGLEELCWLLAEPTCRLVELSLSWNGLGVGAALPLAAAIASNQSLHAVRRRL